MTRRVYIEQLRRQIYGGFPVDDAEITVNLVNKWLSQGIAYAAQKNYYDTTKLSGISYINSSFYTTFKGIAVTKDETNLWKIELPQIPVGLGANEGISTLIFKSSIGELSYPVIWLNQNQVAYQRGMTEIPNKLLGYYQGGNAYVMSTIILSQYTATVTMVSGGDDDDLDSEINVPPDYFPFITDYIQKQLSIQRESPQDVPDGADQTSTV